jgi:hypothetical protein
MIDFWTNFIAKGFWHAVLFMVICNLIGAILRLPFKKVPVIQNVLYWGISTFSYFTIWNIRHGVGWLIFGILGIIGFIAVSVSVIVGKKLKITDENIASLAEEANKSFPQIIDDIFRAEGITTMPGKVWIYRMTILNAADVPVVVEQLKVNARQNILNNIKTSADMKQLRDSDVTIGYEYSDEAGNVLLSLKFPPAEYKNTI